MSRVRISFPAPVKIPHLFFWRHSQAVRQGSAKPWLPGSNPGGASKSLRSQRETEAYTYCYDEVFAKRYRENENLSFSIPESLLKSAANDFTHIGTENRQTLIVLTSDNRVSNQSDNYICPRGGIGRRTGLKILRSNIRIGSSPIAGTTKKHPQRVLFCGFCHAENLKEFARKKARSYAKGTPLAVFAIKINIFRDGIKENIIIF